MNAPFSILVRAATLASLALLVTTASLRAEDNDGDTKPGFFHRLGNAIFKGTRKLEKSDAPDAPDISPENMGPIKPASAKPTPASRRSVKHLDGSSPSTTDGSVAVRDKDYPSSATGQKRVAPKSKVTGDDTQTIKSPPNTTAAASSTSTAQGANASAQTSDGKGYPTATRGKKPGFVKSPYPPYQELDTTGMISGSLARDPTTGKVFRVP